MLILASKSPRRKELITEFITSDFIIVPSEVDEEFDNSKSIEENVSSVAYKKGEDVFTRYPNDIVISADTVVIFNSKVYGKPKSIEEAKSILREFSNNEQTVMTAYHIFSKDRVISRVVTSIVKFKPLSEEYINQYVATDSPLDKAGAYGIQDLLKDNKIDYYKGSLYNVIGLPVEALKKDLEGLI